jgi:hypothetical protein
MLSSMTKADAKTEDKEKDADLNAPLQGKTKPRGNPESGLTEEHLQIVNVSGFESTKKVLVKCLFWLRNDLIKNETLWTYYWD